MCVAEFDQELSTEQKLVLKETSCSSDHFDLGSQCVVILLRGIFLSKAIHLIGSMLGAVTWRKSIKPSTFFQDAWRWAQPLTCLKLNCFAKVGISGFRAVFAFSGDFCLKRIWWQLGLCSISKEVII